MTITILVKSVLKLLKIALNIVDRRSSIFRFKKAQVPERSGGIKKMYFM